MELEKENIKKEQEIEKPQNDVPLLIDRIPSLNDYVVETENAEKINPTPIPLLLDRIPSLNEYVANVEYNDKIHPTLVPLFKKKTTSEYQEIKEEMMANISRKKSVEKRKESADLLKKDSKESKGLSKNESKDSIMGKSKTYAEIMKETSKKRVAKDDGDDILYMDNSEEKSLREDYVQSKVEASQFGIRWSMLTDVINSGIKSLIKPQEKRLQEAMFEIISSEAKYYSGLQIIMDHYYNSYLFTPKNDKFGYINPIDKHRVFSNISDVMAVSKKLLVEFEKRWKNDRPYLHDICDILYEHACSPSFKHYVIYLRNQPFQQESYQKLIESSSIKKEINRLESQSGSKNLSLDSYLILPMQRLTRYKLLADNVLKILSHDSIDKNVYKKVIENAQNTIKQISLLLSLSQSGKADYVNQDLIKDLIPKMDLPPNSKLISFEGKVLIKEAEYAIDSCKQVHGSKFMKKTKFFILLLFSDFMMIGKRNGSRIQILDSCSRKDVIFTSRVNEMLLQRKKKKNVYIVNAPEDENSFRIYLQFENSSNDYLRDPIILKVENREEITSWEKFLPDHNNTTIFDYKRPSNFNYWKTVKQLSSLTNI